ncbi:MAG: ABC transporter ATP-binding protein [Desulfovibrionaceae bacterium]
MRIPFLKLAGPIAGKISVSVLLGLLITACYVAQGIFLALALVGLILGKGGGEAANWVAAFAMAAFARAGLIWASEIAANTTTQAVKSQLREKLLSHLFTLGPGITLKHQTGDLQTTIVAGVEALESYFSRYLPAVVIAVFGCGGVLAVLCFVDWRSAVLLTLFVVAFPAADWLWLRWRMPKHAGMFKTMGAFGAYLLDSVQGIVTLKAFAATQARRKALATRAEALRRECMATLRLTLVRHGLTGLVTLSGVAVVLSYDGWRIAAGELGPLPLFMTLFLAREAFRPLERLEKEFHTAWSASGAVAPILTLLAETPPVKEPSHPASVPQRHDIAFEKVTFAYENSKAVALSQLSFAVAPNEFVALVGPSGAGKSTVVSLLLRFFDPQKGAISIGGTDIRELPLERLRALIGVVSQDTVLFHGSIEDNLRIAKPDATLDEIHAAATAAHIHDFIESLPDGYASEIGERGAKLSGGQRQRLSIARALLKDAPILILDEATSSVDTLSERAIREAIETLSGRRTTLVIAHRLSTVARADRILVLETGKVVEQGTHEQLATAGGAYSQLMAAQEGAAA